MDKLARPQPRSIAYYYFFSLVQPGKHLSIVCRNLFNSERDLPHLNPVGRIDYVNRSPVTLLVDNLNWNGEDVARSIQSETSLPHIVPVSALR